MQCHTIRKPCFILQLCIILFITTIDYSSSSSTTNQNASYYSSITDLDQYGSSPQINNARLASTLHGTLTIAILSIPSNSIHVVSLQKKIPGVISSPKRGRVNIIAQEKGEVINAVIGSGLQSDVTFVVSLLRKHVSECWERYDSIPSLDRVTMDATEVMLCFMGYDVKEEIR